MPYMLGVANKIKHSRFVSRLRSISTQGGKKKHFKVRSKKIPSLTKTTRAKDYSLYYLSFALILIIVIAIALVPEYGAGGLILPAVLVPTLFFIIGALKSLVNRD